jgi:RimJ/RimL family protein N-acetyltransferase
VNTADIKIIPATADNAEQINELMYLSSGEVYKALSVSNIDIESKFSSRLSNENVEKTRTLINSLSSNEKYIVATADDIVIGICYAEKERSKNILHALYVLPEFQGKGVGKLLWNSIKEWVYDKDVYLDVIDKNANAIKFYESLGFVQTGESTDSNPFSNETVITDIEMVLRK